MEGKLRHYGRRGEGWSKRFWNVELINKVYYYSMNINN